jgi:ribosomal protein L29
MKKNKLAEFKAKGAGEIKAELAKIKEQLVKFRLDLSTGKVKNVRLGRQLRRDLAQAQTIARAKELEEKKK